MTMKVKVPKVPKEKKEKKQKLSYSKTARMGRFIASTRESKDALGDTYTLEEANAFLSNINVDAVRDLMEEIENWRDNIEERFSHTEKFTQLEECADALDSIVTELEELKEEINKEEFIVHNDDDLEDEEETGKALNAEVEDRFSRLDSQLDECEAIEFPRAFG